MIRLLFFLVHVFLATTSVAATKSSLKNIRKRKLQPTNDQVLDQMDAVTVSPASEIPEYTVIPFENPEEEILPEDAGVIDVIPSPEEFHDPNPYAQQQDPNQDENTRPDDEGIINVIPNPGQLHNTNNPNGGDTTAALAPDEQSRPDDSGIINVIPNPGQLHNTNNPGGDTTPTLAPDEQSRPDDEGIINVIPNPGQLHNANNPDGGDDKGTLAPDEQSIPDDEGIINVIPNPGQLHNDNNSDGGNSHTPVTPVPTRAKTSPPEPSPTLPAWIDTIQPTMPPTTITTTFNPPPDEGYRPLSKTPAPTLQVFTAPPQSQHYHTRRYTLLPFALVFSSPTLLTTPNLDVLPMADELKDIMESYLVEYFQAVAPLSVEEDDPMMNLFIHVQDVKLDMTLQWVNTYTRDAIWAAAYGTIGVGDHQRQRRMQLQLSQGEIQNLLDEELTQALSLTSLPILKERFQKTSNDEILQQISQLSVHFQFDNSFNRGAGLGGSNTLATTSEDDEESLMNDWSVLQIVVLTTIVIFVIAAALYALHRRRRKYPYGEMDHFMVSPDDRELYFDNGEPDAILREPDALFRRKPRAPPQQNLQHHRMDSDTQQLFFEDMANHDVIYAAEEDYQLPNQHDEYTHQQQRRYYYPNNPLVALANKLRRINNPIQYLPQETTDPSGPAPSINVTPMTPQQNHHFAYRDFPRHDGTPCLLYNEDAPHIPHKEDKEEEEIRFSSGAADTSRHSTSQHLFDDNSTVHTTEEQYEDYKDPSLTLEMSNVFRLEVMKQSQCHSTRSVTSTNTLEMFLPQLEKLYELKYQRYQQMYNEDKQRKKQLEEQAWREQQLEQGLKMRQQQFAESPKVTGISPWEREVQMRTTMMTKNAPLAPSFSESSSEYNSETDLERACSSSSKSRGRRKQSDGRGVVQSILDTTRLSLCDASPRKRDSIVAPPETLDRFFCADGSPALSMSSKKKTPPSLSMKPSNASRNSSLATADESLNTSASDMNSYQQQQPSIPMKVNGHNPFSPQEKASVSTTPARRGHTRHYTPVSPMPSIMWSPDYFASPTIGTTPNRHLMIATPSRTNKIACMSPKSIDRDPTMNEQDSIHYMQSESIMEENNEQEPKFSPRKKSDVESSSPVSPLDGISSPPRGSRKVEIGRRHHHFFATDRERSYSPESIIHTSTSSEAMLDKKNKSKSSFLSEEVAKKQESTVGVSTTTDELSEKQKQKRFMESEMSNKYLEEGKLPHSDVPESQTKMRTQESFKRRHRRYHSHGGNPFPGTFRSRDASRLDDVYLETIESSREEHQQRRSSHHRRHRSHSAIADYNDVDLDIDGDDGLPPLSVRPYGQRHHPLDNPAPPPRILQSESPSKSGSFDVDSLDEVDLEQQQKVEKQEHRRHKSMDKQRTTPPLLPKGQHRRYHSLNSPMQFFKQTLLKFAVEEESQESGSKDDSTATVTSSCGNTMVPVVVTRASSSDSMATK